MLDLTLFHSRRFSAANAETFVVYAALGGAMFLLPIDLQQVVGYSPLAAGAALLPTTVMMLLLSASMGRLAQRIGPRLPLTIGPLIAAAGLLLLVRNDPGRSYLVTTLPALVVFGLGLSIHRRADHGDGAGRGTDGKGRAGLGDQQLRGAYWHADRSGRAAGGGGARPAQLPRAARLRRRLRARHDHHRGAVRRRGRARGD